MPSKAVSSVLDISEIGTSPIIKGTTANEKIRLTDVSLSI